MFPGSGALRASCCYQTCGTNGLLDLGADGVMTDDVVLLRDVLAERGQWHPKVAA
jgi:hypothetical protein